MAAALALAEAANAATPTAASVLREPLLSATVEPTVLPVRLLNTTLAEFRRGRLLTYAVLRGVRGPPDAIWDRLRAADVSPLYYLFSV